MFTVIKTNETDVEYIDKLVAAVQEETAIAREMVTSSRKQVTVQLVHEYINTGTGCSVATLRHNSTEQMGNGKVDVKSDIEKLTVNNYSPDTLDSLIKEIILVVNDHIDRSIMMGFEPSTDDISFQFTNIFNRYVDELDIPGSMLSSIKVTCGVIKEVTITIQ